MRIGVGLAWGEEKCSSFGVRGREVLGGDEDRGRGEGEGRGVAYT